MADATYIPKVYHKQEGDELVVASGGAITIETGGTITYNGDDLIAEIAALSGLDSGELGVLNAVTAGTVTASKAVVVDASKDIGDFRNLDAVNIDAGASGTAGSVDIFPATASSGKTAITAADNAGDTTTTLTTAAQAGARTYTIPDAGASASFLMTEGDQTLGEGKDIAVGTTTGTKIGTAAAQKLGFWNATPVIQPAGALQAALTNSTGGAQDGTLAAVGATNGSDVSGAINDNFTDIYALLTEIRTALVNTGIIKGAA